MSRSTPHRPKASRLHRKDGGRAIRDRVLIVCEGTETEVNYFSDIRKSLRLSSANISILPGGWGTCPLHVVNYAEHLVVHGDPRKRLLPQAFDVVFAVFDRDAHANYRAALQKADLLHKKYRNDFKKPIGFHAIPSVPCFELWLLLHYQDVRDVMHRHGAQKYLKTWIPEYDKACPDLFCRTRHLLADAHARALALAGRHSPHDGQLSYTDVTKVVEKLTRLKG